MALETSPPVNKAGWRRQAVGGLLEGSKRRLQWRQVRQVAAVVVVVTVEEEEGEEEEADEVEVEALTSALSAVAADRRSDRGGQTRHRLSLCSRSRREKRETKAHGVANSGLAAETQRIVLGELELTVAE